GQLLAALDMQLADAPNERRPLRDGRRSRPPAMRRIRALDRRAQIVVADRGVTLARLARSGIDNLVGAHLTPLLCVPKLSVLVLDHEIGAADRPRELRLLPCELKR